MPHVAASIRHAVSGRRDELQFAVAFNVALAARLWRTHFADRMKVLGQMDARWTTLYFIADSPKGVIQTDLAEGLGIKGPTLVRILDALEQQGLVKRHRVPSDRRANSITIETKGREVLIVLDDFARNIRNDVFEGVSEIEMETTLGVLRQLGDRLGAAPPQPNAALASFVPRSA